MMNLRSDKQIIIGHYPIRNDYIVWNYVDKSEDASTAYFLSNEGIAVKPFMKLANGQDATISAVVLYQLRLHEVK